MRGLIKTLSFILVFIIVLGLMPAALQRVFAAPVALNIYVDSFTSGTVSIHWDSVPNAISTKITYHSPKIGGGVDTNVLDIAVPSNNTTSISGLKNDYIYDFKIDIIDGITDRSGLLYYIPQITFTSTIVDQGRSSLQSGGYESGTKPRLKLRWAIPKVYDGAAYVYSNQSLVLNQMATNLNKVYDDGRQASTFNFRINISTDYTALNSGSSQASIIVDFGTPNYTANVSGRVAVNAKVNLQDTNGFVNFDLLGRKDLNYPVQDAEEYALPDEDILPGTVYYMNVKPVFKSSQGDIVNLVAVGHPSDQNGSLLSGVTNYSYTPIRFELSKDAASNLYVRIYKINQGSLDLPRLYYEVQSSDDPSIVGDWSVKKTMDDSYFGGEFTYTVISGINPHNENYYKIVVKSDGYNDRIESLKMIYSMVDDTTRPPVPRGVIAVVKGLHTGQVTFNGKTTMIKSTDIIVSWDKPTNWDQIKANAVANNDVVFHFMLNTYPIDVNSGANPVLEANGIKYGNYALKYRLVKYVSAKFVVENGNRLEYVIDGLNLYNGKDFLAGTGAIQNTENYPTFLLTNKIYYLQMYTTSGMNRGSVDPEKMSDISMGTSFTTLSGTDRDVPLSGSLRLSKNEIDTSKANFIELQFDKVTIDWNNYGAGNTLNRNIYYDLYMSSRTDTDSFKCIASTEGIPGDVALTGQDDLQSTYVKAFIKTFSQGTSSYNLFGNKIIANTTYYFIIKTRLVITGQNDRVSMPTAILPVTTIKGDFGVPDESARTPACPIDFNIAKDARGNLILTGQSVTFTWLKQETGVSYNLICSSEKVLPDTDLSALSSDSIYQSFIRNFDKDDNITNDKKLILDITANPQTVNFKYDSITKMYTFTINRWLFPNRLYYFSLRAEKAGGESIWVSIPVTTSLIKAPDLLGPVVDSELGFNWIDNNPNMLADDYKVYLKGPKNKSYVLLSKANCAVVKDDIIYYARVYNLQPYSAYSVRVFKGKNSSTLVYENLEIKTKDNYHQLEVKWRGLSIDKYSGYEIAIKTEDATDYTTLTSGDLEQYVDRNGNTNSYYTENTFQSVGTNYLYFYAKIKSVTVSLADGTTEHQVLKSNTKYYIKVRALRTDPSDATLISYSKYIGPANIRTDFNQQDYDKADKIEKDKATFLDKIQKLDSQPYWRMSSSDKNINKLLIKGDKMTDAIKSSDNLTVLDISSLDTTASQDIIYIPESVISALNSSNKSLMIKENGAEFTIRPNTLVIDNSTFDAETIPIKDIFYKLEATRTDVPRIVLPKDTGKSSRIYDFSVEAVAFSKTEGELKVIFYDKLYAEKTGLVKQKVDMLLNSGLSDNNDFSQRLDEYIGAFIDELESQLSDYVSAIVEGSGSSSGIILAKTPLTYFINPMFVRVMYFIQNSLMAPYVNYSHAEAWQRLTSGIISEAGSISFPVTSTGEYVLLFPTDTRNVLPDDSEASKLINAILTKYDLEDVFAGISTSLNLQNSVSGEEAVLLYERIMGRTNADVGMTTKQKNKRLGLDKIINQNDILKDITREQAAAIVIKAYTSKLGLNVDKLLPGVITYVNDEGSISSQYIKAVMLALGFSLLNSDESGKFNPKGTATRGQVIEAFSRVLTLTGDV